MRHYLLAVVTDFDVVVKIINSPVMLSHDDAKLYVYNVWGRDYSFTFDEIPEQSAILNSHRVQVVNWTDYVFEYDQPKTLVEQDESNEDSYTPEPEEEYSYDSYSYDDY